jgi:hypothetical protein
MIDIRGTIEAILLLAFRLFVLYLAFAFAYQLALQNTCAAWKSYLLAVASAAVLAYLSWLTYGTHTEDSDPIFGGGDVVDDFQPTSHQREQHALFVFAFLVIPAIGGTFFGRREAAQTKNLTKRCS